MSETFEFSCPSCHAGLRVPIRLAGITGPCPYCGSEISAPTDPGTRPARSPETEVENPETLAAATEAIARAPSATPAQAKPKPAEKDPFASDPKGHPADPAKAYQYRKPRIRRDLVWRALFFIALAVALYWFLHSLHLVGAKKGLPPIENKAATVDSQVVTPPATPEEKPDPSPPIVVEPSPIPSTAGMKEEIRKRTALIGSAQEVLKKFINAGSYGERKPLMVGSSRSEDELRASCLAGPLPEIREPTVETILERSEDRSVEIFFSVPFDDPDEDLRRVILMRVVSLSENEPPLVHADPFIDLYESRVLDFAKEPVIGTGTFFAIIEASAYCFDDIPRAEGKAKLIFFENIAKESRPILTAYLLRDSDTFSTIRQYATPKVKVPCIISLGWDQDSDPTKPYLQVARLASLNWVFK